MDRKVSLLVDDYEDYLTVELRLGSISISDYLREIRSFVSFLSGKGISPSEADSVNILSYIRLRSEQDLDERTIAKIVTIIRSFYRFMLHESIREDNPVDVIELPKLSRSIPNVLTVQEVDSLFAVIDTTTSCGLRDRALFELVYSCGLRISEAVELQMQHLLLDEQLIRVLGKGTKERVIPVGEVAVTWLHRYIGQSRPRLLKSNKVTYALFLSERGVGLSRKGAWKRFKQYCRMAGIDAKIHTLRHSYATHLLAGGADLRVVQELLGHSDISTTQIYTHISTDDLRNKHKTYHPQGS